MGVSQKVDEQHLFTGEEDEKKKTVKWRTQEDARAL